MRTVAMWTIKGGVGKTTAAVNLAHAAATSGSRTLLWDLDPQGATSFYLRIAPVVPGGVRSVVKRSKKLLDLIQPTEFDNLHLLPADFSYRHLDLELESRKKPRRRLLQQLQPLAGRYDLVLIDCAPSVSLVSEALLRAAEAIMVPVIPTTLSMRTLRQVRAFAADVGAAAPRVMPFLSMVDRRKKLHLEITERCLADPAFFRTVIPSASVVERMGVLRAPVAATLPSQPAARAFGELWHELRARLGVVPAAG